MSIPASVAINLRLPTAMPSRPVGALPIAPGATAEARSPIKTFGNGNALDPNAGVGNSKLYGGLVVYIDETDISPIQYRVQDSRIVDTGGNVVLS